MSDHQATEIEHAVRTVQAVLDIHTGRRVVSARTLTGGDSDGRYQLMLDRAIADAERLGKSIAELTSWLIQCPERPRILADHPVGDEAKFAHPDRRTHLTRGHIPTRHKINRDSCKP